MKPLEKPKISDFYTSPYEAPAEAVEMFNTYFFQKTIFENMTLLDFLTKSFLEIKGSADIDVVSEVCDRALTYIYYAANGFFMDYFALAVMSKDLQDYEETTIKEKSLELKELLSQDECNELLETVKKNYIRYYPNLEIVAQSRLIL